MKILDPGHTYEVDSYDDGENQNITFLKREGSNYPGNVGSYPGTNNQELLRVLIDRCNYIYNQIPCIETAIIIRLLRSALYLHESRAAIRHNRDIVLTTDNAIELEQHCLECGHIQCGHKKA